MSAASSRMRFGSYAIAGHHGTFDDAAVFAADLEVLGFDLIGVGDSPGLFRDPYVGLAHLGRHTTRARLATMVTNPVLRHPAATGAAIGSVAELTAGRAVLGLGSGDSALHNSGSRPATLAETEAFVGAVRDLLLAGEASWQGGRCWMRWTPPPVPIFLAASGPRMLRLAGRIADGAVVASGIDDAGVARALDAVASGAADAGRAPTAVEVWWNVITSVGNDRDEAIDDVAFALAARGHHAFRSPRAIEGAPAEHRRALAALVEGYRTREHGDHAADHNADLVRSLGLADFLVDRFAVVGSVADCTAQLRRLARLGVRNVITTMHGRRGFSLHPFATEVVPALVDEVDGAAPPR